MGLLYLGGRTIQEVDGEMMMGLSIYGVAVMMGRYTPDSTVFHFLKYGHLCTICTVLLFTQFSNLLRLRFLTHYILLDFF